LQIKVYFCSKHVLLQKNLNIKFLKFEDSTREDDMKGFIFSYINLIFYTIVILIQTIFFFVFNFFQRNQI